MVQQQTGQRQIVTFSFVIEGGSNDPQHLLKQASEVLASANLPSDWKNANFSVRDPSYTSDIMTGALTGAN